MKHLVISVTHLARDGLPALGDKLWLRTAFHSDAVNGNGISNEVMCMGGMGARIHYCKSFETT